MIHGNLPPLRSLRLFPLIAGLMANWYYAVRVQTGPLFPITADFACGSVVLFYLFQEMGHNVPHFLKKNVPFHPAASESAVHPGKCLICPSTT